VKKGKKDISAKPDPCGKAKKNILVIKPILYGIVPLLFRLPTFVNWISINFVDICKVNYIK